MGFASGVVEKINAKEVPTDQYGNSFQRSIKVGESWYGLGKGKTKDVNVKVGKDFVKLKEGDQIEFLYSEREYNGKTYYDAKSSDIKIKGSVTSIPANKPATESAARTAPPAVPATYSKSDVGIKVGHAINVAANFAKNVGELEDMAWQVIRLSIKMANEFEEKSKEPVPQAETPKRDEGARVRDVAKKKTEAPFVAQTTEFSDDDIPF